MENTTSQRTVAELVVERPGRSRVFEQYGIDYCCGGRRPLSEACQAKGIAVEPVLEALSKSDLAPEPEGRDWQVAPLTELMDHIVSAHHDYLRDELPRIDGLTAKVADAHGGNNPAWLKVRQVYLGLASELTDHMMKEERILFPAIAAMEMSDGPMQFPFGSVSNPIRMMEHEHDNAGNALVELTELTNGYVPSQDACPTTRALLEALDVLEKDLHIHIHKENNILHPRAIAMEATLANA